MGYTASCVLWLGSLVGQADVSIQQCVGLHIRFPVWYSGRSIYKAGTVLYSLNKAKLHHNFHGQIGPLDLVYKGLALLTSSWLQHQRAA